jgi:ATP-dependent exoDNAse (exonuclease V) beta subunit
MTGHPHLLIRASAGSGKTYQLATRYLQLLAAQTPPESILATTFTRKAAGEILGRILRDLAQGASDPKQCQALAARLDLPGADRHTFERLLTDLSRRLHVTHVSTLDSFFARLATAHTLELGLPPDWTILEEIDDQDLRSQAIADVLEQEKSVYAEHLVHLLSPAKAGPAVLQLMQDTVDRFYDVYCRALPTAWEQLPTQSPLPPEQLKAAVLAVEQFPLGDSPIGRARDEDIARLHAENWKAFVSTGISGKLVQGESDYRRRRIPEDLACLYRPLIEHARSCELNTLAWRTRATRDLLDRFHEAYRRRQWERGGLRFDDVARALAVHFDRTSPRSLTRLGVDVAHLLLDEFQDTSPLQWSVLRPCAMHITQRPSGTSFLCVGDSKQAIYGWRGGVAEIFDTLTRELQGLVEQPLSTSHRSAPPVIEAVNRIFQGLTRHPGLERDQPGVEEWCRQYQTHSTSRGELNGYACLRTSGSADVAEESKDDRTAGLFVTAAEIVRQLADSAPEVTIGVLVRKNESVAHMMDELRRLGVSAGEEGGNPVVDSAAVQAILSLIGLADHPGDTVAAFHVANSPLGSAVGLADPFDGPQTARLARELRHKLAGTGYGGSVAEWARILTREATQRDRLRLKQLVDLACQFDLRATLRPGDFVRYAESQTSASPSTDRVQVMTIHKAKGLQFDAVVVPLPNTNGLSNPPEYVAWSPCPADPVEFVSHYVRHELQPLLPAQWQSAFDAAGRRQIAESLSVLYVALTRAIHGLYIVIPQDGPNARQLPRNYPGLLRAALTSGTDAPPDTVLFEVGDPRWFERGAFAAAPSAAVKSAVPDGPDAASRRSAPVPTAAGTRVLLATEPAAARRLTRSTPSQRYPQHQSSSRLREILAPGRTTARAAGAALHACLEQIVWLDEGLPDESSLRRLAARFGVPSSLQPELSDALRKAIRHPAIGGLLRRREYLEEAVAHFGPDPRSESGPVRIVPRVANERRFAVILQDELLTGSIDRLVLLEHAGRVIAADIIDFKTDAVDPEDSAPGSERVERYRPQMEAYAQSVCRLYGLPAARVRTRLAFTQVGSVVTIATDGPSEAVEPAAG